MMTLLLLILSLLVSSLLCYVFTATEAALVYLPHGEADDLIEGNKRPRLARMLEHEGETHFSVRFWRVLFETLSIVLAFSIVQHITGFLWISAIVTAIAMTLIGFIVFGTTPRRKGRAQPARFIRNFHPLLYLFTKILGPIPARFRRHEEQRPDESNSSSTSFTEEELREFVVRASSSETIEDDEAQMVHSIFELDETRIRSVMVPRTDMVTLDIDEDLRSALSLFMRSGYSRVPVLGDDFDDVRGFLYLKDVMEAFMAAEGTSQGMPTLHSVMRDARFEPESKRVMDLLKEMQRESTHVAIVVDEYGGTAGLVTLEDLIEELVGDISDEFDNEKPEIKMEEDGTFKISSRLSIEELGELFGRELEEEEVDTVGGLLSKHLGRVPIVGSEIEVEGIRIRAIGTRGRRNQIGTLLVWVAPEEDQTHDYQGSVIAKRFEEQ